MVPVLDVASMVVVMAVVGFMVVVEYMVLLEVCFMPLEDMVVGPLEAMGVV